MELIPAQERPAPSDMEEVRTLDDHNLAGWILEILPLQIGESCNREEVTTLLLKRWNIVTRSGSRMFFEPYVDDVITKMINQGLLYEYTTSAGTTRVKRPSSKAGRNR
ncbi:MAG: hypothetical protein CL402_01740 [Acidiferrobacteraceae bacterium]|nr:hypothetical protein [Acidiferrobacteraceae bacterium]